MSEHKPSCEIHARYSRGCSECHSAEMDAFRATVAAALAELRQHLLSEYDPEVMPDTMLQRINAAITKLGLGEQ